MADISKINVNETEYNLKDATARSAIENTNRNIQSSITPPKASVVTVTDAAPMNAEDITVDITPKQDLHGYDRPWDGGAGKNKLDPSYLVGFDESGLKVVNNNGVLSIAGNPPSNFNKRLATSVPLKAGTYKVSKGSSNTYPQFLVSYNNQYIAYVGATEQTITIPSDGAINIDMYTTAGSYSDTFYPMIRLATETDATFAPYSNICPISGYSEVNVERVGVNIGDEQWELGIYNTSTGEKQADNSRIRSKNYISVRPSNSYRIVTPSSAYCRYFCYDINKNLIITEINHGSAVITTPNNCYFMTFNMGQEYGTTYNDNISINYPSTATTYEPYQGQQYTVNFGETVYGGKWHSKGGVDKTHANIASYNGETINEPWLSSLDEYVAGATPTTGAQVVYPLTTPTTINTNAVDIPMLQGINTISGSTGDVSLKYQPDNVIGELKGEIQKANGFVSKMALREGSGAKDFSYGGWSFRLYIYRSMGQISMSVERISASSVTEQAVVKVFNDESDYRAPEELRPRFDLLQAATYTTPSGWAIQVYLKDDGYIMFTGIAPEVGASAPTSSNWNLVEPWATHQQAKDLFNN